MHKYVSTVYAYLMLPLWLQVYKGGTSGCAKETIYLSSVIINELIAWRKIYLFIAHFCISNLSNLMFSSTPPLDVTKW